MNEQDGVRTKIILGNRRSRQRRQQRQHQQQQRPLAQQLWEEQWKMKNRSRLGQHKFSVVHQRRALLEQRRQQQLQRQQQQQQQQQQSQEKQQQLQQQQQQQQQQQSQEKQQQLQQQQQQQQQQQSQEKQQQLQQQRLQQLQQRRQQQLQQQRQEKQQQLQRLEQQRQEKQQQLQRLEQQRQEKQRQKKRISDRLSVKISIVMAYYDRKEQLLLTLSSFEKLYGGKYNLEVIIVDDMSDDNEKINDIVKSWSFKVKLIELKNKTWFNPVIPYNVGINHISPDTNIIILQNPEIFHCGNILDHAIENISDDTYLTYPVFASPSFDHNTIIRNHANSNTTDYYNDFIKKINYSEFGFDYEFYINKYNDIKHLNSSDAYNHFILIGGKEGRICNKQGIFFNKKMIYKCKGWFNHIIHNPRNFHFLSAMSKSVLDKIGGFCNEMAYGMWYDDDDLLNRIKKVAQVKTVDSNIEMGIHLYHKGSTNEAIFSEDMQSKIIKNRKILQNNKKDNVIYCDPYNGDKSEFEYPRIMHLYWDKSPLSFLNYLTVVSFNKFHTGWKIKVYTPKHKTNIITWKTHEQKLKYTGKCYFKELYNISNVEIIEIDLSAIGFYSNASEVMKSDYFRYHILYTHGGLWSDFDIIYTGNIEKKMNFKVNAIIFRCSHYTQTKRTKIRGKTEKYYPVGLFLAKPKTNFFNYIKNMCISNYQATIYQSIGAAMFLKLFPNIKEIYKIDNVYICDEDYYLPWAWNQLDEFLVKTDNLLPNNNIGIHWFNGANKSKQYAINLDKRINNFIPFCTLDKYIKQYMPENNKKTLDFLIYFKDECEKIRLFISSMINTYKRYNINLNIITEQNINFFKEYGSKININIFKTFNQAINTINNNYIFYQNLIVLHKEDIFELINNYNYRNYDYIGINKQIENKNLSDNFKQIINNNKIPDILFLNKNSFITKKIKIGQSSLKNKDINFLMLETNNLEFLFPKKIPKIIHFYWDGNKFDYLTSLCLKTFVFNNPDWEVNLWMPKIKSMSIIKWETQEFIPPHSLPYNGSCFFDKEILMKDLGININNIDYFDLGLKKNYHEIMKSDIFRWKVLSEIGGVWSDMDILFVDKIEKTNFDNINHIKFNDIDLVVSQYKKHPPGTKDPIDFYYIGFLMASKNSHFFQIMYEESLKNIKTNSYQGVGGDLMKSHFGLFKDIEKKIGSNNYVNLQSDSIYYYWWGDLKNLFFNKSKICIFERLQIDNIIGFHWFRGVHLSKIYTHFNNNKNKIQQYENFNGPLVEWTEYYKSIFNDFKVDVTEQKISIVMGYINRLNQLEITIQTILNSKHKNFEIIIVNDGKEDLNFLISKYSDCRIVIIDNSKKNYINPGMSYNLGIEKASGEIIILQNPECCHIGDILTVCNTLLKPKDYLAFSCYYLDNYKKNNLLENILFENNENDTDFWNISKIKKIMNFSHASSNDSILSKKHKGWCSHHKYNPNYLHFCTAIYKSDLVNIGCFDVKYKDGICFDDDDLVRKVILNDLNYSYYFISETAEFYTAPIEYSCFCIHQHHDRFNYSDPNIMDKWEINKQLFIEDNGKFIEKIFVNE